MKILYVTTVIGTMPFFINHFKRLRDEGHEIELACNKNNVKINPNLSKLGLKIHDICFSRSPFAKDNIKAAKMLDALVCKGDYDVVHCHTPVAAAITRVICNKYRRRTGLKVFYTCHGFHFYKGAPLKNWLIFYPIEWFCAKFTDKLITINTYDFSFARRHLKTKEILYIPGVGIDLSKFEYSYDTDLRFKLGLTESDIMLLSVGELNNNKNHKLVINSLSEINNKNVHYFIAGEGYLHEDLLHLAAEKGLADNVHLLGFRDDVPALYKIADLYIHPSLREGLSVSIMEAMASGLPCIVGNIRGNVDLIDANGGMLFNPSSCDEFTERFIDFLVMSDNERDKMGKYNKEKIKYFSNDFVLDEISSLY